MALLIPDEKVLVLLGKKFRSSKTQQSIILALMVPQAVIKWWQWPYCELLALFLALSNLSQKSIILFVKNSLKGRTSWRATKSFSPTTLASLTKQVSTEWKMTLWVLLGINWLLVMVKLCDGDVLEKNSYKRGQMIIIEAMRSLHVLFDVRVG